MYFSLGAGTDTGFPIGGRSNIQIRQISPKNCIKLNKFYGVVAAHAGGALPWIHH